MDRRTLLTSTAAGLVGALLPNGSPAAGAEPGLDNAITRENSLPGSSDWQLTYVKPDGKTKARTRLIEGYCSHPSVAAGETLRLFVSTEPAAEVTVEIYRLGYYGGLGGRFMTRLGPSRVEPQSVPAEGEHRLHECRWAPSFAIVIPENWTSGVYVGKLRSSAHRYESYVIFIVRDARPAEVLFQCSDNTWQAYNKWPENHSLYDADPPQSLNGTTRVSFDRPYGQCPQVVDQPLSQGSGEFLCWEFPCAYWLEQQGIDVSYCSNMDQHERPEHLRRGKVLLSVGHDEYWTVEMYYQLREAISEGLSVGFLSGNTCCFLAPMSASSSGQANRVFYRGGRFGGLTAAEKENRFGPFDFEGPNENLLIGARTVDPFNGSGDWIVTQPEHWLFANTGLKAGDRIPGLVGWEFHGEPAAIPGLELVAKGTTINSAGREAHWTATIYPGPKGNWVFNASTIFWSMGLAQPPGLVPPHSHYGRPHGPDRRVQQVTANFLKGCGVRVGDAARGS